jgi:predicted enzyme related to lactoylglutathione lyase
MINTMHLTVYTSEKNADKLRTFLRDVLKIPKFDAGGGWLIFHLPGEIGFHPDEEKREKDPAGQTIGFACTGLDKTVADLKKRGVQFLDEIRDEGWGRITSFRMPGGLEADLYEPRYRKPSTKKPRAKKKAR